MSDYLVNKICNKFNFLEEKDHSLIRKSLIEIDENNYSNDNENLTKLNLNLENYIINVIEIIDDIKKLIIKLEKKKRN
ncbi:MAG: hypothetical protein ISQ32_00785 [Rickettsiales bacterium]|nr:hypothetical protein [Rickettsiales bacterium]